MKNDSPDALLLAIGQRIRARRIELDLTQEGFGKKAGLLKQYTNRLEAGRQNLSLRTLHRVAVALNTTMSSLLRGVERDLQYPQSDIGRLYR